MRSLGKCQKKLHQAQLVSPWQYVPYILKFSVTLLMRQVSVPNLIGEGSVVS
jgi:hypothetical protein